MVLVQWVGHVIDALIDRRHPKCGEVGSRGSPCGLKPAHWGFHKSARQAWPNERDSAQSWAELGRRIRQGEAPGDNGIPFLSYDELAFAMRR